MIIEQNRDLKKLETILKTKMMSKKTLIEENGTVSDFIDTLNEDEMVQLWETVNSPEYIALISDNLKNKVNMELDELMANIPVIT
jgi:uncharacterized protein with ParB-like and HNH nuclease domain